MTDMPLYHKIQSIWKRTERGVFMPGEWARPEIGFLAPMQWEWTEKIDGTNIRIHVSPEHDGIEIGGRTDRAQIPADLVNNIHAMDLPEKAASLKGPVVLYGEGYGAKIQKGGGNYRPDQSFVLFDVRVGDYWLEQRDVEDVASTLNLRCAPVVMVGTIQDGIDRVGTVEGVRSAWGDFRAEGLVGRPLVPLFNRKRERIICKVKSKDFDRLRREGIAY